MKITQSAVLTQLLLSAFQSITNAFAPFPYRSHHRHYDLSLLSKQSISSSQRIISSTLTRLSLSTPSPREGNDIKRTFDEKQVRAYSTIYYPAHNLKLYNCSNKPDDYCNAVVSPSQLSKGLVHMQPPFLSLSFTQTNTCMHTY